MVFFAEMWDIFNLRWMQTLEICRDQRHKRRPNSIIISQVFHSLYKVGRNGILVFKGFNNNKKKVTSSGARPDATDYYWFRSPVPNHMS